MATFQDYDDDQVHIGLLVMHAPLTDVVPLQAFGQRMVEPAEAELETASGSRWQFHWEEPVRLSDDESRFPADFLEVASFRKAEGPYDAIIVITDVPLLSKRRQIVAGLASTVARVIIVSTHKFMLSPRNQPVRPLDADNVHANSVRLLLHLFGHLFRLRRVGASDSVMAPYRFAEAATLPIRYSDANRAIIHQRAASFPDKVLVEGGPLRRLWFYLKNILQHPSEIWLPLTRSRAPLIPLSLPRLTTAAVAPALILIFSAEIWDVALHMSDAVVWITSLGSVVLAAWYLMVSLHLFFPSKERRILTEHSALINTSVFITLLMAVAGLFAMIFLMTLGIEYFIFPQDLMREWPSLENPEVDILDKMRLAGFIGTLGVVTGALAGGLESNVVVRELALFRTRP